MKNVVEHDSSKLHVGLIGDGVRRWAKSNNIPLLDAYIAAGDRVAGFIDFFFDNSASTLSLYMLSKENLNRPKDDLQAAVTGEQFFFETILTDLVKKWDCRVYLAGDSELLPEKYLEAIHKLMVFPGSTTRKIYLLAGYNPIDEMQRAYEEDHGDFIHHLWVKEPVDIVIRTSGEHRISNFLPLQSGYAELFFLDKHINDLETEDCYRVLKEFEKRHRRMGK